MEASCQCGAVHFSTPLPEPLAVYHCHCAECRKQSASAFGTSAIFPSFTLPDDQPVAVYTRKTDGGGILDCYFCEKCGVRVLHARRGGNTVSVKGGCIDGLDWSIVEHIWVKRAVVAVPEGAKRWEGEPDD
ncbi:glutathione-dependent formaldehyde-activating [Zopfia rhizophila CBS 207.26]|uniref:Glutathione-dependent formaldehyde-activating n=1 Tax=Zopfia rhizophila CBS 207.26 TaxID=1314779 RepID=A0A6A6DHJ3_9PEZI|nr:glutathione-dependent formaldehyde-activating [Zopfia rhizophila CBS 207.26]